MFGGGRRFERSRATRRQQQQVVVGRWRTVRSCHFRSRHVGPRAGRDERDGRTGFWRGTLPVRGETSITTITSTTIGHNLLLLHHHHHLLGSSLSRDARVCIYAYVYMYMYMCVYVCTRARARARVRGRVSLCPVVWRGVNRVSS